MVTQNVLFRVDQGVMLVEHESGVGVLSFLSKVNCASERVLSSLCEALYIAEKQLKAMVIWQENEKFFCAGADLPAICERAEANDVNGVREYLFLFQKASLALRYSKIPVVAGVRGFALGGGCEVVMHCDAAVAHRDAKIGLVETLVGLIPAGGGCKEMVYRAAQSKDYMSHIRRYFFNIGSGIRSKNAEEAKTFDYLRAQDRVVDELEAVLPEAKALALSLVPHYEPPSSPEFASIGEEYSDELLQYFETHYEGGLSDHDHFILRVLADAFCPGQHGEIFTEEKWLETELNSFMRLAVTEKSRDRIRYTLEQGKSLKN